MTSECNACRTAQAALRNQVTAYQTHERTLAAPLETEQQSIQTAIDALKGKQPDAALEARMNSFQTRQKTAARELSEQQQQIQRNQQYIQRQIQEKISPIYQQVMTRHGANFLVEVGSTLASAQNVDVTNDVLAGLNASLPTIATTAPAAPQPQQPQGR